MGAKRKKTLRLEIDRARWRCGSDGGYAHGKGDTALRNRQGYMCCLGFRMLKSGKRVRDILDRTMPHNVRGTGHPLVSAYGTNTEFAMDAAEINDNRLTTRAAKEKELISLAAKHGEEWVFVGQYEAEVP